jgi:hypothetical protein
MANPSLGLADMKKLLLSARKRPTGGDLTWHLQVQAFICVRLAETGIDGCCTKTRSELSLEVAKQSLGEGHVARRIASHEISWITNRYVTMFYLLCVPTGHILTFTSERYSQELPGPSQDEGSPMAFED